MVKNYWYYFNFIIILYILEDLTSWNMSLIECLIISQNEINGKALVGLSQGTLLRLGITNPEDRDAIWRQILKLRLKADIQEMKEIQMRSRLIVP